MERLTDSQYYELKRVEANNAQKPYWYYDLRMMRALERKGFIALTRNFFFYEKKVYVTDLGRRALAEHERGKGE